MFLMKKYIASTALIKKYKKMRKPKPISVFKVINYTIKKTALVNALERNDAISKAKYYFEKKFNIKSYCHDWWSVTRLTNRKTKINQKGGDMKTPPSLEDGR
jgi:hypothetical protein